MSPKRKRKPRKNQNTRTPRSVSSTRVRQPTPRRPARPPVATEPEPDHLRPEHETESASSFEPAPAPEPELEPEPIVEPGGGPALAVAAGPELSEAAEPDSEDVEPLAAAATTPRRPTPPLRGRSGANGVLRGILVAEILVLVAVSGFRLMTSANNGAGAAPSSANRYAPPVRVPVGTSYVRTRVIGPEQLRVTHWIHTHSGVLQVRVRVPHVPGLEPGAVQVSRLVVASDGRSVPGAAAPQASREATYVVPPGRQIYVSYVLTGAVQLTGSSPGRALARITSLDVVAAQDPVARTMFSIVGARVLALACAHGRPSGLPRPCGRVTDGRWQVDLRNAHTDDRVMAQMDLS
jgi:hypothetical protein